MRGKSADFEAGKIPVLMRLAHFRYIEEVAASIETGMNFASVVLIMFLMFFATGEVAGRYIFNQPIPGHVEITEQLMAAVVFLGIAYTQRVGGHIRMELFMMRVIKGRMYHFAECLTIFLSLVVYAVITIYSFKTAMHSLSVHDTTAYLYWPTWPSKLCISIGSFFLCVRFILQFFQHLCQALDGIEMKDLT
ncbi:MAG: TRAP transporter small permease [Deltaproteobacteria bacterium]|nr:TRAP transporter small permease [Deltaproteobacteria bacterium]